jgi:hypothetical protein
LQPTRLKLYLQVLKQLYHRLPKLFKASALHNSLRSALGDNHQLLTWVLSHSERPVLTAKRVRDSKEEVEGG